MEKVSQEHRQWTLENAPWYLRIPAAATASFLGDGVIVVRLSCVHVLCIPDTHVLSLTEICNAIMDRKPGPHLQLEAVLGSAEPQ